MSNPVIIISGLQGEGKTTFLKSLVGLLNKNSIIPAGILALGSWKNNLRESFTLYDIQTGKKIIFAKTEFRNNWKKIRRFYINPEGEQFGKNVLGEEKVRNAQVVIIDEIGPFELKGEGWAKEFSRLLSDSSKILVISVREQLTMEVIKHFKLSNANTLRLNEITLNHAYKQIQRGLRTLQE